MFRLGLEAYPPDGRQAPLLHQFSVGMRDNAVVAAIARNPPQTIEEALISARQWQSPLPAAPPPSPFPPTPQRFPTPQPPRLQSTTASTRPLYHPDPRHCDYCQKFGKNARHCGHNNQGKPLHVLACVLPHASEFKPLVLQDTLGGKHSFMLIDSGAALSLIHSDMTKHCTETKPCLFSIVKFIVANNLTLDITGAVEGVVHVGGIECTHTFLVSPEAKWNVIIGCDFLRAHD